MTLEYPGWALAMIIMLIVFASLPVPVGYIYSLVKNRWVRSTPSQVEVGQEMRRELYTKCSSTEQPDSHFHPVHFGEDEVHPRPAFLSVGNEHYRLLSQEEDEEEEEQDTGVWAWWSEGSCLRKDKIQIERKVERQKTKASRAMNSIILGFYVFIFSKPLKSCFNYVFILYHPPSASLYLFSEPALLFRR